VTLYLANAFSLNMLHIPSGKMAHVVVNKIEEGRAAELIRSACRLGGFSNIIGHHTTDEVVRSIFEDYELFAPVGARKSVLLHEEDILIVAQYIGPRLEEGTTTLPDGARIEWFEVYLEP